MKKTVLTPLLNPLITIIWIVGIIYLLVSQKTIIIPLVLGTFFALLLLPAVKKLEKYHFSRIISNLVMIFAAILILGGIAVLLSFAISEFISSLPQYTSTINAHLLSIQEFVAQTFGISLVDQKSWVTDNLNIVGLGAQHIGSILSGAGSITSGLGLTFIYTFFLLYYRDKLKIFLQKLFGDDREAQILDVAKKIGSIIPRYLIGLFKVVILLAILTSFGLWAIGVNNPLFWGIIIAVLNIVPYIGTAIGFVGLIIFTILTQSVPVAIGAIVIFFVTQFIDNNFLTPNIAGGNIDINPLAAIIGLIVIGSMWGTIGLVIALPIVGVIKVICDTIPQYEAVGYLLGNSGTEEHAISWENIKKVIKK